VLRLLVLSLIAILGGGAAADGAPTRPTASAHVLYNSGDAIRKLGTNDVVGRGGRGHAFVSISPSGQLAYLRSSSSGSVFDGVVESSALDGSRRTVIARVQSVANISWSRDGRTLYYIHSTGGSPDRKGVLSWRNVATGATGSYVERGRLGFGGQPTEFAISPTGRQVVLSGTVYGDDTWDGLVVLDLAGSGSFRTLRRVSLSRTYGALAWTAAGIIARRSDCGTGGCRRHSLVLLSPTTGAETRTLSRLPGNTITVHVSANGRWISIYAIGNSSAGRLGGKQQRLDPAYTTAGDIEEQLTRR
jgi:hypothetical protein